MDKISRLPDELLVKVLSFLPTKVAVGTSTLSKRWEFLWMWLPKLEYDYNNYSESERKRLRHFINLNLPLHRAPVIESLRLSGPIGSVKPKDIKLWVVIAVSRCVRELSLQLLPLSDRPNRLPSSLYTCKSLVVLKLKDGIVVDVPRMACLPSLKTLLLQCVTYSDENSLHQLLSKCPVLEDLVVERDQFDHSRPLSVFVPSLLRLTLTITTGYSFDRLVINTPSLKYLKVTDLDSDYSYYYKDMPKLEEVDIDSIYPNMDKYAASIAYAKRLSLCTRVNPVEALYREGIVFHQLEHLKICSCDSNWSNLLVRLLKDSTNLRELEVYLKDDHTCSSVDPPVCWQNQLDCAPTCLLTSLKTFKWTGMYRSQKEIDLVKYILRNACCLKTATISFRYKCEKIIEQLSSCSRSSTTCQLILD